MNEFEDLLEANSDAQKLSNTPAPASRAVQTKPAGLAADGPVPLLWNRKPPQYVRQQEQAWHRIALEMAANGYTAVEIAARLGCTPTAVQDILRQPQYQKTQVELIRKASSADQEVLELVKSSVVTAVKTLATIVEDSKARSSDRIAAARELLDRRYGKPNQPTNRGTDVDLNTLSDKELAAMLPASTSTGTNG